MYHSPPLRWLTLDAAALRANFATIRRRVGRASRIIAVVKANAYGHGMELVAQALRTEQGLWGFAVANIREGLALRAAGIRTKILVLSYCEPELLKQGIAARLSLVVYDRGTLRAMARAARSLRTHAYVHVKIDTGTHRIGVVERDALRFLAHVQRSPYVILEGVFSHYASSEDDLVMTRIQTHRFKSICAKATLDKNVLRHIACSAAAFRLPSTHFDAVRAGIALYGLAPWLPGSVRARLRPVLSWHTRLLQVKSIQEGDGVGYGQTFRARKAMRIGILPIGYADGYDRRFSNNAQVVLRGKRCPVIGRVSMNLTVIDCSTVPSARGGEVVTLLGAQKHYAIRAADLAERAHTLHYEVVTRINANLPRITL